MDSNRTSKGLEANTGEVFIGLGHFLPGGTLLPEGLKGTTDTYRGIVEVTTGWTSAHVKIVHPWFVFNEVLGSLLCQRAGLKTPRPYVVLVERADYPEAQLFSDIDSDQALAFATETMPHSSITRHILVKTTEGRQRLMSQWSNWADILVFDQWIANPDRHLGNLLIGGPGDMYLIDHSFAFLRRNWEPDLAMTARALVTTNLWSDFLAQVLAANQRMEATPRIAAAAMHYSLIDVTAAIAASTVSGLLPDDNIEALIQFLAHRISVAASTICNVIGVPALDLRSKP